MTELRHDITARNHVDSVVNAILDGHDTGPDGADVLRYLTALHGMNVARNRLTYAHTRLMRRLHVE